MRKVYWATAPKDAQFYSLGGFRKYEDGVEFSRFNGEWVVDNWPQSLDWHRGRPDFEIRPEDTEPDWKEWNRRNHCCPTPKGHDVEVKFLSGRLERDTTPEGWDWGNEPQDHIVAYRDWTEFYESPYK